MPTGDIASATLKTALRDWQCKAGTLPPELIADERRARAAYPDVILLGTWFAIAELTDGRWQPFLIHEHDTPAAARTTLTTYLRQTAPTSEKSRRGNLRSLRPGRRRSGIRATQRDHRRWTTVQGQPGRALRPHRP